jgi:hypothetical protein
VVDELKLRPLALTVENGFMPHETRQNIDNAVRILGVDHVYIPQRLTMGTFSPFLQAWKHRPNPAMIAFLCNGCQGSIKGAVMKATRDNGVNLAISGSGEPQTDPSFAIQLLMIGTRVLGRRGALVCGALGQLLSNPLYLRHPSCLTSFAQEGIARFWFRWPENLTRVSPFAFIGWSEDYIVDTIKYRVKWNECANWPTTWRADCKVHWLKEFLYKETLGFTKNDDNLSGMVREGMITREEALTRLSKFNDLPESYLAEFVAEHGVDFRQLREACHRWRRSQET